MLELCLLLQTVCEKFFFFHFFVSFFFGKSPQWQAGAGQTKSNYYQAGIAQTEAAIN